MYRKNGVFVENYGVTPDLEFKLSVDDYRTGFKGTLSRLLKTIDTDRVRTRTAGGANGSGSGGNVAAPALSVPPRR